MDVDLNMVPDVAEVSRPELSISVRERQRAVSVAALILFLFAVWIGLQAPLGILSGTDELLTAERSREMVMTGQPWVVHYNFQYSFEKPPLQYWLTSFT